MKTKTRASAAIVAVCLTALAGCGGGGGGGSEGKVLPAAPTLSARFGYKVFHFTWASVATATFYRLSENPDGASGYTVVANNLSATNYDHAFVSLFGRLNAKYLLEACNASGCTPSAPLNMPDNLSAALGAYVKASNTEAGDSFGFPFGPSAIALSADGNTLAVGAIGEDSALTGVIAGAVSEATAGNGALGSGAVYIFARSGAVWSQQAYVKASNTGAGDQFGNSVALSADGNTLAVGAPDEDSAATGIGGNQVDTCGVDTTNCAANAGAVYVFTRSGVVWSQQAYVKASNTGAGDQFGGSVALSGDGDTLAVGATEEDSALTGATAGVVNDATAGNAAINSGAVYVYVRSAGAWSQQAYVKASNTGSSDAFGKSVALSGNGSTLAVGAPIESSAATGINNVSPGQSDNSASNAGAVYVFVRGGFGASNPTEWNQKAYVKASNAEAQDQFGQRVALSSDGFTLAVAATGEASGASGVSSASPTPATDNDSAGSAGAVYVFVGTGFTWAQQAYVKASNPQSGDTYGISIGLSGDGNVLAVGASGESSALTGIRAGAVDDATAGEGAVGSGVVYLYSRSGTIWSQEAYVKASNTDPNNIFAIFGQSVAVSGDGNTLAVAAPAEGSAATGVDGNQINSCGVDTTNCAANSGAVYLY